MKTRKDGTGSIYKTTEGWRAQVRYFDEFEGRSKTVRRRAASRDEARALLKQLLADTPTGTGDKTLTVADYLDLWAVETLPVANVKDSTADTYRRLIHSPPKPTLGKVLLADFDPRAADRWLARLDKARSKSRKVKPTADDPKPKPIPGKLLSQSTKRQTFAVLSLALDTAVRDGLIDTNPLAKVDRPRKARTEQPVMTAAEVDALLAAAHGDWIESLVVFVANTGCRIGEALALSWSDVDLAASQATIRRSSLTEATTKTAAGLRTVPLVADVVESMKRHRRQQMADQLKVGPGWQNDGNLVFVTGVGTPLDAHNARRALRRLLAKAELPTSRPWHTMRHSLATRLLNRGVPMPVVSQILGHASIRTTVDLYGHSEPALSAAALAEVLAK